MNDQGLGVPDVGEVRGEDAAVDKGDASCVCVCLFERKVSTSAIVPDRERATPILDTHTHASSPLFLTFSSALHPKAQHGTKQAGSEILLGSFVRLVFG